jgi:hypothetical protein
MKKLCLMSTLLTAAMLSAPGFASTVQINFDSVAAGSAANSAAPAGIQFNQAHFVNDTDAYGDEIPNTEKWQIDTLNNASFPVTVDNPASSGYGAAISGNNALNALWQPVLMHFDTAINLTGFSVVADNSTYGDLSSSYLYFLDSGKNILSQVMFDQTAPGALIALAIPVNGVRDVLLPSGAFYDNFQVSSVPLPASLPLFLAGLAVMGVVKRRKAA